MVTQETSGDRWGRCRLLCPARLVGTPLVRFEARGLRGQGSASHKGAQ
jgi:hypothetical protein